MDSDDKSLMRIGINVNIGKEAERTACELIKSLLGVPISMLSSILGEQVAYWKWCNTIRLAKKVADRLAKDKIAAAILPPSFAVPLLEAVATTDDESLQDMWARLLQSAISNPANRKRAFVETMKALGPEDAAVLLQIADGGGGPIHINPMF